MSSKCKHQFDKYALLVDELEEQCLKVKNVKILFAQSLCLRYGNKFASNYFKNALAFC